MIHENPRFEQGFDNVPVDLEMKHSEIARLRERSVIYEKESMDSNSCTVHFTPVIGAPDVAPMRWQHFVHRAAPQSKLQKIPCTQKGELTQAVSMISGAEAFFPCLPLAGGFSFEGLVGLLSTSSSSLPLTLPASASRSDFRPPIICHGHQVSVFFSVQGCSPWDQAYPRSDTTDQS